MLPGTFYNPSHPHYTNRPDRLFDYAIPNEQTAAIVLRSYLWPEPIAACELCGSGRTYAPLNILPFGSHRDHLHLVCTNQSCLNREWPRYGKTARAELDYLLKVIFPALHLPRASTSIHSRLMLLYMRSRKAPYLFSWTYIASVLKATNPKGVYQRMNHEVCAPMIPHIESFIEARRDRGFRTDGL